MIDEKKMTTTSFLCQTKQKSNFSNNYYVKKTQKKHARKKNVYKNFIKKLLQKIKKIQNINQYVCTIKTKFKHIATQIKRDIVEKKTINEN